MTITTSARKGTPRTRGTEKGGAARFFHFLGATLQVSAAIRDASPRRQAELARWWMDAVIRA